MLSARSGLGQFAPKAEFGISVTITQVAGGGQPAVVAAVADCTG